MFARYSNPLLYILYQVIDKPASIRFLNLIKSYSAADQPGPFLENQTIRIQKLEENDFYLMSYLLLSTTRVLFSTKSKMEFALIILWK